MTRTRKLVRMREKGQVPLPADVRRKLGLKKGDWVAVIETAEGVLLTPKEWVAFKALDRIGEVLQAEGVTLDELIESGREQRGKLLTSQYGLRSAD